jgi:hypothetical protein
LRTIGPSTALRPQQTAVEIQLAAAIAHHADLFGEGAQHSIDFFFVVFDSLPRRADVAVGQVVIGDVVRRVAHTSWESLQ